MDLPKIHSNRHLGLVFIKFNAMKKRVSISLTRISKFALARRGRAMAVGKTFNAETCAYLAFRTQLGEIFQGKRECFTNAWVQMTAGLIATLAS